MGHYLLSPFGANSTQLTELMITVESHPLSFPLSFFLSFFLYLPAPSALFRHFSSNPHPTSPILPRHHRLLHPPFPSLAPSLSIFIYLPLGFLRFNQILCFPPSLFFSNSKKNKPSNLQFLDSLNFCCRYSFYRGIFLLQFSFILIYFIVFVFNSVLYFQYL